MPIAMARLTWVLAILIGALLAFALLAAAPSGPPLPAPSASAADKDCSDFSTQKKAQKFFKKHNPKDDPHGLDADNDGLACETNPCPCVAGVKSDRAGAPAFSASSVWADRHGRVYAVALNQGLNDLPPRPVAA